MVKVVVKNVTKKIAGKTVLDDVSFEVESGTITSIVGPAGAGKSTLLKIIAGVEAPDSGRILIDGRDVTALTPKERDVAMVFQTYALYPHMTVFDNIAFPLRVRKMPESEIKNRVKEIAELLGITHILQRTIYEVSGGEAQRTALARALVRRSRLVLLDEPLTNLDYKIREKMRAELKKISKEFGGATWIYATPDAREAMSISSHVVFIHEGKVLQWGRVDDIYNTPNDFITASYFAYPRMNTFICDLFKMVDRYYIRELTGLFRIDVTPIVEKFKNSDRFIVGIRPSDMKLTKTSKRAITLPATIKLIEAMGSDTIIHLDTQLTPEAKITELQVFHSGMLVDYRIGQRITLYFEPENVLIFDENTKKLIAAGRELVPEQVMEV